MLCNVNEIRINSTALNSTALFALSLYYTILLPFFVKYAYNKAPKQSVMRDEMSERGFGTVLRLTRSNRRKRRK